MALLKGDLICKKKEQVAQRQGTGSFALRNRQFLGLEQAALRLHVANESKVCSKRNESRLLTIVTPSQHKKIIFFAFHSFFRNIGFAEITLHSAKQKKSLFFFVFALVFS